MAVGNFSPSGFSYAQAARGSTAPSSQPSVSKVTSGAATPATSVSLEASSGGNWADDVEETEGSKTAAEPRKVDQEESKQPVVKDNGVDRMKVEEKLLNGVSGVSSPDTTGSSITSLTTRDESPSAPTGSSSDITWDTKSQASEPAWITERKERQNGSPGSDATAKPERKGKKNSSTPIEEPKVAVLQEAAPPTVNPWQKRAQEAKAKTVPVPKSGPPPSSNASTQKENQEPSAPTYQRKQNAVTATPREQVSNGGDNSGRHSATNGKRSSEARVNNRPGSKSSPGKNRAESGPASSGTPQSRGMTLPSVKDETSWPTPETALEKERKSSLEKDSDEKRDEDSTPSAVKRRKDVWKPVPVVPTIIWETQSMNEPRERKPRVAGSERGGRGGARGRGAYRGGASTVNGGDRQSTRPSSPPTGTDSEQASKAAERENVSPALKQTRGASPVKPSEPTTSPSDNPVHNVSTAIAKDAAVQAEKDVGGSSDSLKARSPTKSGHVGGASNGEISTPAPIPRKSSAAVQPFDGADKTHSEPPVRMVPTDNRKDVRTNDAFRDHNWTGAPRGMKRSGRGRGGNGGPARDIANGHGYGGSYGGEFNGSSPYGVVPTSPSAYTRGNPHQFSYPPPGPGRGGWSRGGPRSQSIPIESYYPRFASQPFTGAPAQMANVQTYMPGMSEFTPMQPMSAIMPSPTDTQENLLLMVTVQLDYYFGVENMIRDMFLRKHMDSQGFVFLDFVAGFNRLKHLTSDRDLLKTACLNSENIEILVGEDGRERLRKREGWEQFVRPVEERDASAQSEGPQRLERPERPQLSMPNGPSHFQGPYSAGLPTMHPRMNHRSYDSGMPIMNGFAPQFVPNGDYHNSMHGGTVNGEEIRGRSAKSPIYENGVGPTDGSFASADDDANAEPDAFPDEQVGALGIVVRMSEQLPPYHSAATRTFSNGSIDSRSIAAEMDKKSDTDGQQLPNGGSHVNGGDRLPSLSRHLSPSKTRSPEQGPPNVEREVCWAKDVNNIPEGTTYEPYTQLRLKALDQRNHAATGNCPYDLDVLYQFWCHFLCRNFNNHMYQEFQYYAQKDARERHSLTGINNLLKFYAHSLNSFDSIRERIAKDYVELVKNEPPSLEGAAFKQLRSAWRNGALNLKNRKRLADILDEQLKSALDTKPEA